MADAIQPQSSRPHMPGYGTLAPDEGSGLLPWSWAEERLTTARNFWLATIGDDAQPHLTPVWGFWDGQFLWFTCAIGSRKARNLWRDPRCTVSTEDAGDPVVMEGTATVVTDMPTITKLLAAINAKYETNIGIEFADPKVNSLFRITPVRAFGLKHDDFTGSPTRWTF